jgi:hypothetical protein
MKIPFPTPIDSWPIQKVSPDPWLPLPPKGGKGGTDETPLNYEAFEVYAQQAPSERSIARTARIRGKSTSLMERYSS